jgi:hypothetical protein
MSVRVSNALQAAIWQHDRSGKVAHSQSSDSNLNAMIWFRFAQNLWSLTMAFYVRRTAAFVSMLALSAASKYHPAI